MPRNEEQNAAIRDQRKTKILDKSLRLFATKGFDNVSVDDITLASNCSHGLFYHYFKNKEDVYLALMELKKQQYKDYLIPREEMIKAGGYAGLKIIAEYCEKICQASDNVVYFVNLAANRHFCTSMVNNAIIGDDVFGPLTKLIKEGQKDGDVVAGDPMELAHFFIDFCNGAMSRRILVGKERFVTIHSENILRIFSK